MSDGPQRLNNALIEQRSAVEPQPGAADNEWELRRDRNAELVLLARDLHWLGPDSIQPRELMRLSAPATAANFGVVGISHPAGFWLVSARNNSVNLVSVQSYSSPGAVLAQAGWSAAGVTIARNGWRPDPNFVALAGVTTAVLGLGFEVLGSGTPAGVYQPTVPLWVEPGRVFALTNHILPNTLIDCSFDVIAPTTLGVGT